MSQRAMRRTIFAVSVSSATAVLGVATALVVWAVRRMNVGSVGLDRDRYDVYYDLMRQTDALAQESSTGR